MLVVETTNTKPARSVSERARRYIVRKPVRIVQTHQLLTPSEKKLNRIDEKGFTWTASLPASDARAGRRVCACPGKQNL